MCNSHKCSIVTRFSKFSLGMYVLLISFPSILPVVPTECDVLIVCRQHNDKEWKFNSMQKCVEILRGRKDTLAPVVSTLRGRASPSLPPFRRLWCSSRRRLCVAVMGTAGARSVIPGGTTQSQRQSRLDIRTRRPQHTSRQLHSLQVQLNTHRVTMT